LKGGRKSTGRANFAGVYSQDSPTWWSYVVLLICDVLFCFVLFCFVLFCFVISALIIGRGVQLSALPASAEQPIKGDHRMTQGLEKCDYDSHSDG